MEGLPPRLTEVVGEDGAAWQHFCEQMHVQGWCVLRLEENEDGALEIIEQLQTAAQSFFRMCVENKEAWPLVRDSSTSARSVPEPTGYLRLFDYEILQVRNDTHLVRGLGSCEAERTAMERAFEFLHSTAMILLRILHQHLRSLDTIESTRIANLMQDMESGTQQASLLRFVHYFVKKTGPCLEYDQEDVFEDHKDFGLLTLVPISRIPGLHLWHASKKGKSEAGWFPVEETYAEHRDANRRRIVYLLAFCGETLDHVTGSYFPAVRHKVTIQPTMQAKSRPHEHSSIGRISSPFFLRAHPTAMVPCLRDRKKVYSIAEFEYEYDS